MHLPNTCSILNLIIDYFTVPLSSVLTKEITNHHEYGSPQRGERLALQLVLQKYSAIQLIRVLSWASK